MAADARFKRPGTLTRSGTYIVYTVVEFYGLTTTCMVELYAYNSAGQALYYPWTDPNSIQTCSYSGVLTAYGVQSRYLQLTWVFKNATLSSQAWGFCAWLYDAWGNLIDYYQ